MGLRRRELDRLKERRGWERSTPEQCFGGQSGKYIASDEAIDYLSKNIDDFNRRQRKVLVSCATFNYNPEQLEQIALAFKHGLSMNKISLMVDYDCGFHLGGRTEYRHPDPDNYYGSGYKYSAVARLNYGLPAESMEYIRNYLEDGGIQENVKQFLSKELIGSYDNTGWVPDYQRTGDETREEYRIGPNPEELKCELDKLSLINEIKNNPIDATPLNQIDQETLKGLMDPANWKEFRPSSYEVQVIALPEGTEIPNQLEWSVDKVYSDRLTLEGTAGEQWNVAAKKISAEYCHTDDTPITDAELEEMSKNRNGEVMTVKTIESNDAPHVWAIQVPAKISTAVKTDWGAVVPVNHDRIDHGGGDWLVVDSLDDVGKDGTMRTVNGIVFERTYEPALQREFSEVLDAAKKENIHGLSDVEHTNEHTDQGCPERDSIEEAIQTGDGLDKYQDEPDGGEPVKNTTTRGDDGPSLDD